MKTVLPVGRCLCVLALLTAMLWVMRPGAGVKGVARAAFPLQLAWLSLQEPDPTLALPIRTLQVQQIRDTWHAARAAGRLHQGQDLFARRGTPVYSATAGYVVRIGETRLGGRTVSVMGAGWRLYYYAHLDAYAPGLAVGEAVTADTLLGYVGTSGNARGTPPHLHFGVYTVGGAMNPLPLLRDRAS
jgi:murein DD-endopeptidase MepM/ murein hydrolase activator NlpD